MYYFLKANIDGVEIEFNTKDKNIVQNQLDEYFGVIMGVAPTPKLFETKEEDSTQKYEEYNASLRENINKPVERFSLGAFETKEYIADENNYVAKSQSSENQTFNEIYQEKSSTINEYEKNAIEYDNIEIQKENVTQDDKQNFEGLNLYQPKVKPELFEFMQNKHSQGIFDDFIISAYFIKNVLEKKSFSIKFLNSKLYSAKEKLVDFAILNDAIRRGFLNIIPLSDSIKEYTLSETGEAYFFALSNQ